MSKNKLEETMKKLIATSLALTFAGLSNLAMADPYADKIEITSGTNPMSQMVIETAKVPDRALVGIPAYPGAKVFQTRDAGEMEIKPIDIHRASEYIIQEYHTFFGTAPTPPVVQPLRLRVWRDGKK